MNAWIVLALGARVQRVRDALGDIEGQHQRDDELRAACLEVLAGCVTITLDECELVARLALMFGWLSRWYA